MCRLRLMCPVVSHWSSPSLKALGETRRREVVYCGIIVIMHSPRTTLEEELVWTLACSILDVVFDNFTVGCENNKFASCSALETESLECLMPGYSCYPFERGGYLELDATGRVATSLLYINMAGPWVRRRIVEPVSLVTLDSFPLTPVLRYTAVSSVTVRTQ